MFQTTEDYIDDARLERELTGDELMLLPNEDIGTESDLDVELDDNESVFFPLGYFWKWFNFSWRSGSLGEILLISQEISRAHRNTWKMLIRMIKLA